jgi:hypothetical protein
MVRLEKSRIGMHHLDGRPTPQKKALMKQRLGAKFPPMPAPPPVLVAVDYPQAGERVVSREYAIRFSVLTPGFVEVSIDDDAWRPCRQASGFWWYDWSAYGGGAHTARARITQPQGRRSLSERRDFVVELP